MTYDVFISYRREGGDTLAQLLYDRLTHRGYRVFLDIESLNAGKFNEKLLDVIEECKDVIVVLPPHGLDRCVNEGDWVYRELQHAMEQSKNIIPVMMKGFEWPENIPEDIAEIMNYNGILDNKDYFDAVIDKLTRLMKSKPIIGGNFFRSIKKKQASLQSKARKRKKILAVVALCLVGCAGIAGFFKYKEVQQQKITESYVSIEITPPEDMAAVEYTEALDLLEKRFEILAGDEKWYFKEDKGTIKVSLPVDVFHGIEVSKVMQSYVTRPTELYLESADDAEENQKAEDKYFHIERSDIEDVTYISMPTSKVDMEDYLLEGLEEGADCQVLTITLDDQTVDEIKAWSVEKQAENFNLVQDGETFESSYYYKVLENENDDNKLYVLDNYQYDNILKLVQFNYTNDTFSQGLRFSIEKPVHWERKKENSSAFGRNQKNVNKLTGELRRYDFSSFQSEMTQGEYDDLTRIFKERLDTLGTPYAFGYQVEDPHAICVKIDPRYMDTAVVQSIGVHNGLKVKSNFYDILTSNNIESMEVQQKEDGTYCLELVPTELWMSSNKEEITDALSGEEKVSLCLSDTPDIPLDTEEFSGVFTGEKFVFDGFSTAGLKSIDEKTKFIYEYLKTLQTGDDLPFRCGLQKTFGDGKLKEVDYIIPDSTIPEEVKETYERCLEEIKDVEDYTVEVTNNGQRVDITVPCGKEVFAADKINQIFQKIYEQCNTGTGDIANVNIQFRSNDAGAYLSCVASTNAGSHSITFQADYGHSLPQESMDAFDKIVNTDDFYQQFTIMDYYKDQNGYITYQNR